MLIFYAHSQPFGLLSNNAITPFTLDGREWQTVTEYIYVNAFSNPYFRTKMEGHVENAYNTSIALKEEQLNKAFSRYVIEATKVKLKADPSINNYLKRYAKVKFDDDSYPELEDFINNQLHQAGMFRKAKINRIAEGVKRALASGQELDKDSTLLDLEQYEIQADVPHRDVNDSLYTNLDNIVPYLERELKAKRKIDEHSKSVEVFKDELLSLMLDKLITEEFPIIKDLERAKAEEMSLYKMKKDKTRENLYQNYLEGKVPQDILNKIPKSKMIKPMPMLDELKRKQTIHINEGDALMPHSYIRSVVVDGVEYQTALHYVYQKLFEDVLEDAGVPHNRKSMTHINIHQYSVDELNPALQEFNKYYTSIMMVERAKRAMQVKFEKYSVLAQLLSLTGDEELIWDDPNDIIFGHAENKGGKLLMNIRRRQELPPPKLLKSYRSIMDNLFFKDWIIMRFKDLMNTASLFDEIPSVEKMFEIYRCPVSKYLYTTRNVKNKKFIDVNITRALKVSTGANYKIIEDMWRLIAPQINSLLGFTERKALEIIILAQRLMVNRNVYDEDTKRAYKNIVETYDKKETQEPEQRYVSVIASGHKTLATTPNTVFAEVTNNRILYFGFEPLNRIFENLSM